MQNLKLSISYIRRTLPEQSDIYKKSCRSATAFKSFNYSADVSVLVSDEDSATEESAEEASDEEEESVDEADESSLVTEDVTDDVAELVVEELSVLLKFPLYITMKLTTRATTKKMIAATFVSLFSLASFERPEFL